LDATKALKSI